MAKITRQLWVDDVEIPVGENAIAVYQTDQPGLHQYTAKAIDELGEVVVTGSFYVTDPSDTEAPVVSISNITHLEILTAPKQVIGSVNDVNLKEWMLFIREQGESEDEFRVLAEGNTNVDNQSVGTFDPTLMQNGQFSLVLQATDMNGLTSVASAVVSVEGDLKVGNFSITFEDVNIPVAGIPIVVTRTYDSRQKHKDLDFGFGWSVDYQNVRIHESRLISLGWSVNRYESGTGIDNWCVQPNGNPIVSITLPDGRLEKFKAKASPECQLIAPATEVEIVFEAMEGTTSTLEETSYGKIFISGNELVDLDDPGTQVDPNQYKLTTVDGYVFNLDQGFSISDITTPTGHSLTYTNEGVTHSGGKSVSFARDTNNRITSITLPDGNVVGYEYDAQGNLLKHIDELEQATSFTYDANHTVLDIIDANGVTVTRNEYDDSGRLTAQVDGEGNRIEFTHDIEGRREVIKNRRGFTQVFTYDEMGNVLTETNALGETITRTYDAMQNVLSETNALGHTTSWSFDSKRNKLTETNGLGDTTSYSYNSLNKLLTETDANDVVLMTNSYHPNGNIEQSINALGQVTDFGYDMITGQVSDISDAVGVMASIGYDADYPTSSTDSNGVVTTMVNDSMGRKLSESTTRTLADGSTETLTTSYVYDEKGRLTQITDAQGNVTKTEFNIFDKETASIDSAGRRTEYAYDIRGNLISTTYPDGLSETNVYDEENNLVKTTDRNGAVSHTSI